MNQIADSRPHSDATSQVRHSPYRWAIGGLILLAHLGIGVNFFSISPLLTLIIDHYRISNATGGLLLGLGLLVAAGFGLPGGALIARLGAGRVFAVGGFMAAVLALSAIAPNYPTLLLLRLGYGVGFAFVLTATGPLLMQWFPAREILILTSLNTAVTSLGIALSLATAAPLAERLGWQNTLGLFGAVPLLGAVAWAFLGRAPSQTGYGHALRVPILEIGSVLRSRAVLLLIAADSGILVQYTALTSWLPSFYTEIRGLSLSQAGLVTGVIPLVGVGAVLLGGFLPYRTGGRRMYFLIPGVMAALGGPASFLLTDMVGISVAVALLGIGSWLYVPLLLALPIEMKGMTPERIGIVWGAYITVGGVGMFLSPLIVGMLRDVSGGFLPGFLICAVAAWALIVAALFMPRDIF